MGLIQYGFNSMLVQFYVGQIHQVCIGHLLSVNRVGYTAVGCLQSCKRFFAGVSSGAKFHDLVSISLCFCLEGDERKERSIMKLNCLVNFLE